MKVVPKVIRTSYVIAVPDLDRSAEFYRDKLGFEVGSDDPESGWRIYSSGDCTIMAGRCPEAMPPSQLGDHSYFAYIEIADIASYYESVCAAGAQVGDLCRDDEQGMLEFCVDTVDGHRIMFGSSIDEKSAKRKK